MKGMKVAMVLFTPARLGALYLKNRMIASPVTPNFASPDGLVTERTLQFYQERARSGVAMVITEGAYIHPTGKAYSHQLGIYHPILKDGLTRLVDTIHAEGALACIQLHHAGWRTKNYLTGHTPLSTQAETCYPNTPPAKELSTQQAEEIIRAFAVASKLAKDAGFDGVDIHGAHGYLITCFMSPANNHRTDRFGGASSKERMNFATELVKAIRAEVGRDFAVMMKISADEFIAEGYSIQDMKTMASILEEAGVDALTVSAGTTGGSVPFDPDYPQYTMRTLPMGTPHNAFANFAAELKQMLSIPVIAVGKIHTAQDIETIVGGGMADFVALGRSLVADPEWVLKVKEGREMDIRPCIACNQGCFDRLANQQDIRCTVNPNMGIFCQSTRTQHKKTVMVVGGGAAGMQAAITASQRGHHVSLWEAQQKLGGQMLLAAVPPDRQEITPFTDYLVRQVQMLDIDVHLNTYVDAALIEKENPDSIILATGGQPVFPQVFRKEGSMTAWDLLASKDRPTGRFVVLGGGLVGCETADLLAENPDNQVTIVEMLPEIARDAGSDTKSFLKEKFKEYGVRIICGGKLESFKPGMAVVSIAGQKEQIPCDYLVVAIGTRADQTLADKLGIRDTLTYVAGDALQPKRILDAVADGNRLASIL